MTSTPDNRQLTLVPRTYQGSLIEQRTGDGYINASSMCRAAGKTWTDYRTDPDTLMVLPAIAVSAGVSRNDLIQSIAVGDGPDRDTWVHPQVAIHLAQWLSPSFAAKVTEWVYEWITGRNPADRVWRQFEDRVSLVYDNVPEGYWCIFREIADIFAAMISRGVDPGTRMILDISVGQHWATYWRDNSLGERFGDRAYFDHYYPNYFAQSRSNPQPAACYPEDALPTFKRWMREVYIPIKMTAYLRSQVMQKKLPPQLANDTIAALEHRSANRAIPRREA